MRVKMDYNNLVEEIDRTVSASRSRAARKNAFGISAGRFWSASELFTPEASGGGFGRRKSRCFMNLRSWRECRVRQAMRMTTKSMRSFRKA